MDAPAPQFSLKATGRSRRRLVKNKLAELAALLAATAAIAVLAILVWSVLSRGIHALNLNFFTKGPAVFGQTGGGVAPAIVGSALLVGIATLMALPFGVATAIYVSEFAPQRIGDQIRLWLDVLNGFPSIVIGIFVFTLMVQKPLPIVGWGNHQSAFAGGFALAVIMLPLVARATIEVLALVPNHLREASYALGVSKWNTVVRVVLPTSFGGILTGTTLAIARAAGETAPLLFTILTVTEANPNLFNGPNTALATQIFSNAQSPYVGAQARAWGAALTLVAIAFLLTLIARIATSRLVTPSR